MGIAHTIAMNKATIQKDVAATILLQIEKGGNAGTLNGMKISPLKMMGATDFVYGEDFVQFKVQGNRDFNKIVVKLNRATDSYDVVLWNIKVGEEFVMDKVDEYNDVYAGELGNLLIREAIH